MENMFKLSVGIRILSDKQKNQNEASVKRKRRYFLKFK